MDIKSVKKTMRIGMMGPNYPVPAEIAGNVPERIKYLLRKSGELGCRVLQLSFDLPQDDAVLREIGELAASLDVELEVRMPPSIWNLTGDYDAVKADFDERIRIMGLLGGARIMRGGYGRLKIDSSRYDKEKGVAGHLKKVTDNLKLAAKIVEDNGVFLAIENHCDFKGVELAGVFADVNSRHVGCALDTANGYTVFCDPDDDVQALAPFTLTTHMKDMLVIQEPLRGRVPFYPVGCALGEGHVDLVRAIDTLAEKAMYPENLHMIIEAGWFLYADGATQEDKDAYAAGVMHRSVDFLKKHLY